MDGSTQIAASNVITLSPQKEPLYIANTASSSSTSSSTTNSSSTQTSSNSTMSVNYGDSSVVLGTSGY
ncbi:hypothetical protein J6W20_03775 [bacterium]|nr:hypothetical protein [bacterium]